MVALIEGVLTTQSRPGHNQRHCPLSFRGLYFDCLIHHRRGSGCFFMPVRGLDLKRKPS